MTVTVQKPYNILTGDGSITTFPFSFGIIESLDLLVLVDGVLMLEYSTYEVENLTDAGGDVVFTEAPEIDAVVIILRKTTITQQVDYVSGSAFPAETHEGQMDKTIFILQELIYGAFGGVDSNGNPVYITFDLSVTQGVATVTINNSGGTDAVLPAWVSGTYAGVYHGETTLAASVPADGATTDKPDGYIWLGI